jgi:hypothetical protein
VIIDETYQGTTDAKQGWGESREEQYPFCSTLIILGKGGSHEFEKMLICGISFSAGDDLLWLWPGIQQPANR